MDSSSCAEGSLKEIQGLSFKQTAGCAGGVQLRLPLFFEATDGEISWSREATPSEEDELVEHASSISDKDDDDKP